MRFLSMAYFLHKNEQLQIACPVNNVSTINKGLVPDAILASGMMNNAAH